jgi:hypothetical protein
MRVELYDLGEDLGEHHNLAAAMPEKADALRRQLHAWRADVNAQMPTPNPNYAPAWKPSSSPDKANKKLGGIPGTGYSTDALKVLARAGLQND